jgi:hypothetical protein
MLLTAVSLDSSSSPGILIILGVHNGEVFAKTSGEATTNLEVSYAELGVLRGRDQFD